MTLHIPFPQVILHRATAKFLEKMYSELGTKTLWFPRLLSRVKLPAVLTANPQAQPWARPWSPFLGLQDAGMISAFCSPLVKFSITHAFEFGACEETPCEV